MQSAPPAVAERFFERWTGTGDPESATIEMLPVRLSQATADVLNVPGAGLSVLDRIVRVPLGASNDAADTAERLQFTFGEGPCLAALNAGAPIRADEVEIKRRWPALYAELVATTSYRSVVSIPVQAGLSLAGALDLYLVGPAEAGTVNLADVGVVAAQISAALTLASVATTRAESRPGPGWLYGPTPGNRMMVWVAIGMVNSHHHVNSADALAILRAWAYSHDRLVDDIAHDLVNRTLAIEQLSGAAHTPRPPGSDDQRGAGRPDDLRGAR